MDDVGDNVVIARPFETDARIFGVWRKYFDATFVIVACILTLLCWRYMWHIDIDVLGFVWGFKQSSFAIHPTLPIKRRTVVFLCAISLLELN